MALNGFGSLVNATSVTSGQPEVGMAATILGWTDRHPATVVRVSPSGKTCWVRECRATRTDSNGWSEVQTYVYVEDETAHAREFRLGKRGWRESGSRGRGCGLALGRREKYFDFSF